MRRLFLVLITVYSVSTLSANETFDSLNIAGTEFYTQGKYPEALASWKKLMETGVNDPDLYINIGNAAAMLGKNHEAILYYEKALRFRPSNRFLHSAISEQRSKIEAAVMPIEPFFLSRFLKSFLSGWRPGTWATAGLLLILAGIVMILRKAQTDRIRLWLIITGGVFILIAWLSYRQVYRSDEAIVFTVCDFREAPVHESPLTRQLHPGEKIEIEDQLGEWYKVSLLNLDKGWITKDCVEKIF